MPPRDADGSVRGLPASPPKRSRFKPASEELGWHRFGTQAAALEYVRGSHSVWAQEKSSSGARLYIVATREDFWRRYRTLPSSHRKYYELIRAEHACHLSAHAASTARGLPVLGT